MTLLEKLQEANRIFARLAELRKETDTIMKQKKTKANYRYSCKQTPTRRVDLQVNGNEFQMIWMATWLEETGRITPRIRVTPEMNTEALAAWQKFWLRIKQLKSYSVRVNGRYIIHNQRLMAGPNKNPNYPKAA